MNGRMARAFRAYQKIKTLKPARSLFDLSHEKLLTCDMFKLYPVCAMEMSPGDTFHIWNQSVTRLQPLNAPILSEITQSTHYFFVPYRILWSEWVKFITGGEDGEYGGDNFGHDTDDLSEVSPELPRWIPTKKDVGSLWDYFGLPVNVDPKGAYPVDFLRRAYNMIWNEFYRDENHQDEVSEENEDILYRAWKKDYFTSALDSQQRGVSPSLPVTGSVSINAQLNNSYINIFVSDLRRAGHTPEDTGVNRCRCHMPLSIALNQGYDGTSSLTFAHGNAFFEQARSAGDSANHSYSASIIDVEINGDYLDFTMVFAGTNESGEALVGSNIILSAGSFNEIVIYYSVGVSQDDASITATSASVTDLRQAFQIQKWLELANRGGIRYTEFLRAFFGVSPRDDRLQRPEYIGGSKSPVVISEVLQTSATTNEPTPQGYMAGHGLGAERTYIGSYSAREYGIVIGLMSYTTPPLYQQGINRQWLRRTKYDFLFPQFTGLSEQAIEGAEIYVTDGNETENRKVWGFNEVYDELRSIPSMIVGKMRTVFDYWHLGRKFSSKPALNQDFISGKDVSKRIFAVQNEEGIICHYANIVRAVRPLPKYGTPRGV